ncbi:ATP-binding protein [Parablastomonas sp. CN1-191]|uniref:ATP-binding protein n=1 Tax=Parablastomonas sp. CN1-191 TaxID=3400908 RepID=UPI003BF78EB3
MHTQAEQQVAEGMRLTEETKFSRSATWPTPRLVWPFIIVALVVGWVAVWAEIALERRDAENAAIKLSQDRATSLAQHVDKILQVAELTCLHLGTNYLTRPSQHAFSSSNPIALNDPSIDIAGVAGAAILDAAGQTVARTGFPTSRVDWQKITNSKRNRTDNYQLYISDPQPVGPAKQNLILISKDFYDGGRLKGIVVLFLKPDQFLNFPAQTKFSSTDLVSVINLDGVTIARRDGNTFSSGENVRSGLVMRKQRENPNGTYLGPSSLDGLVRYFTHRRLKSAPVFVTAGISHRAAILSANRRAAAYVLLIMLLSAFGLLAVLTDLRERSFRRQKTLELSESTRRLREAQKIGKIGDWEYDPEEGVVIWSDQLCEMYERAPNDDKLTFEEFAAYLKPEEREIFRRNLEVFLASGDYHSSEFEVVLASGAVSYRRAIAVASRKPDGQVDRIYGTDQDITYLHINRELEKRVAHLDQQGAMSMMAATLAHELNQPLTAASNYITGTMRIVRAEFSSAGEALSGLAEALGQIHYAAEIIRRVRKMVKTEPDPSKSASVSEAVAGAIHLLSASGLMAAEEIATDIPPELPAVSISPVQLQQILLNILKNALEAVPSDRGRVSLAASHKSDGTVRLEVKDNGPGFSMSSDDPFVAFESTKEAGIGLGLSISRTIAEYYGGKLFIGKSNPGETVVVIQLNF